MMEIIKSMGSVIFFYIFVVIAVILSLQILSFIIKIIEFVKMLRFLNISIFDKNNFLHQDDWQIVLFIRLNAIWQQKQAGVGFILANLQKIVNSQNNIKTIWELGNSIEDVGIRIEKLTRDSMKLEKWAKMFCDCNLGFDEKIQ